MTSHPAPQISVDPDLVVKVSPEEPFTAAVKVANRSEVVDAYDIGVLGLDPEAVQVSQGGRPLPLFPDNEQFIDVAITLPSNHPSGPSTLWVRAASRTDPSRFSIVALKIDVVARPKASVELDPQTVRAGAKGRFGLTISNDGNTPLDLGFLGKDDEKRLTLDFVPDRLDDFRAGATKSIQVMAKGRRPFTGSAQPRSFTIVVRRDGETFHEIPGTFLQKPLIPQLALVFAAVVILLGVWAVIVGAAIDAVMEDSKADLADSFESGMSSVAEQLENDTDPLEDARQSTIAAAPGGFGTSTSDGADSLVAAGAVRPRGFAFSDPNVIGIGSGSATGLSGTAVDVTLQVDGEPETTPLIPVDGIVGTIVAQSDGRPVAGAKVTLQALLPQSDPPAADPNRDPLTVAADEQGLFSAFKLLPGTYSMTIGSAGYRNRLCTVAIPQTVLPPDPCGSGSVPLASLAAGESWTIALLGQQATIAGIVTGEDGKPLKDATIAIRRIGQPSPSGAEPPIKPVTVTTINADPVLDGDGSAELGDPASSDEAGRFSFTPPAETIPGIFELTASWDQASADDPELVTKRLMVTLDGGADVVGQIISLTQVPPTMTTEPASDQQLTGVVTQFGTDAPLANVIVQVADASGPTELTTSTDALGTYDLEGLKPGTYNVLFTLDGYRSVASVVDVGTQPTADAVMVGGARIRGTVTDSSTGLPISGIAVSVGGIARTTDDIGSFDVVELAPGTYPVSFTGGGAYADATATVVFDGAETRIVNIALRPIGSLSGIVSDPVQAVPGASVIAIGRASGRVLTTTTDTTGQFRFDQLAPELYDLTIAAEGYTSALRQGLEASGQVVTTELAPTGLITGSVTPAPSGTISVTVELSGPRSEASRSPDPTGFYSFGDLPPGVYQLTFTYMSNADPVMPEVLSKTTAITVSGPTTFDVSFP